MSGQETTITPTHPGCADCLSIGRALTVSHARAPQATSTAGNTHPEAPGHGARVTTTPTETTPPALAAVQPSALAALGPDEGLPPLAVELLKIYGGRWKYAGVQRDTIMRAMKRAGHRGTGADIHAAQITRRVLMTPQAARDYPMLTARLREQMGL